MMRRPLMATFLLRETDCWRRVGGRHDLVSVKRAQLTCNSLAEIAGKRAAVILEDNERSPPRIILKSEKID